MSFSNDVRNELARTMGNRTCCQKAELAALVLINGRVNVEENGDLLLNITLDNAATARKTFKMFKEVYGIQSSARVANRRFFKKNRYYTVTAEVTPHYQMMTDFNISPKGQISRRINSSLLGKACCKRSFLRGVFLSRGFVNRPEGNYHLEIICHDSGMAEDLKKLLASFDLPARSIERKNSLIVYLKESEKIVDFLRLVGANKALLDFENVRIIKSMRNTINRQVNCETANLAKTVDASVRQIELIKRFTRQNGWNKLPPPMRELAVLRVDYPDLSLKELGMMMEPILSKSGVAYRMRKLEKLIEESMKDS